MDFDLKSRTIFLTISGSRAYGTHNPQSDFDLRGICTAPLSHSTGVLHNFEQFQGKLDWDAIPEEARSTTDVQIYDVKKFIGLALNANPNIIELLFVDPRHWIVNTPVMSRMREVRKLFLSRKVRYSYAGYSFAQIKRIRSHRQWLLHPVTHKPTREEYGLPEHSPIPPDQWRAALAMVERQITDWTLHPEEEVPVTILERMREQMVDMVATVLAQSGHKTKDPEHDIFNAAGRKLGMADNFLVLLDAEKKYRSALNHYKQFEEWKKSRNPERAKLEEQFGYDVKHGMHCVRLFWQCEEIMTTGHLSVTPSNVEELREIRRGAWSFDKLMAYADEMEKRLDALYNSPTCPLPKQPDRVAIDKVCSEIVETFQPLE